MGSFGSDFVNITDEEGNSYELEHLFTFELDENEYSVFLPAGKAAENDHEMILLRVVYIDGEEQLENIPEEDYERVYDRFMDILYETE